MFEIKKMAVKLVILSALLGCLGIFAITKTEEASAKENPIFCRTCQKNAAAGGLEYCFWNDSVCGSPTPGSCTLVANCDVIR